MRVICRALLLGLILSLATPAPAREHSPRVVRVGAFNYYPAIFLDADGVVKGFYVDMLAEIGRREGWQIDYVPGSWSQGLERLKSGEVDVLTSVAKTEERAEFMDFGGIPLLTVWGELYVPQASTLGSITDLEGKTIAVMKGDFNARNFIELVKKFGVHCEFVDLASFDQVFQAVNQGRADGGVASVVFGSAKHRDYGLKATGVMFNPFDIYFAVAKGRNGDLLATFDQYLESWRADGNSVYHQARLRWNRELSPSSPWMARLASAGGVLLFGGLGFILWMRHQTGRKIAQREARLQESTEMIRLLLDSTGEAIFGLDREGNATFCNAACLRLLGYDHAEQLIGKNMHALLHHSRSDGSPIAQDDCAIYQALRSGKGVHVDDGVFRRADGSGFPVECWSYPIRREGEWLGSVVTFVDISHRKRAEATLKQKNAELERFVYTVSHDLKSPLVTIKSFLGLLQQDLANNAVEEIDKDIAYLKGAADSMDRLISELLQLSRAGRELAPPVEVGFQQIVSQSLAALAGCLTDPSIEINLTQQDVPLFGDPVRLGQIWSNLIENAVKYQGDRPLTIDIGFEAKERELVFFVGDNGLGIEPCNAEKVFGLFEQLDGRSEGSGLGLALVKKIVELYQGRIWVVSDGLGQGSCFRFTLPGCKAHRKEGASV